MSQIAPVRVLCYSPPVWFSLAFSYVRSAPAFTVGRVIFLVFLSVSVPGPFSQWYIARLALNYFALSSASDAAASGFVPRFQRPGVLCILSRKCMFGFVVA